MINVLIVLIVVSLVIGVVYFVFRTGSDDDDAIPVQHPGSQNQKRYWLLGTAGSVEGKNFHIGRRTSSIGRSIGNHVQIADTNSSRVHCQLSPTPYGLEIRDNDSRIGTVVNDQKIKVHVLKDQDVVSIGTDVFTYREKGNFGEDAGLKGKSANAGAVKATVMEGGDFKQMLQSSLENADGDTTAAAKVIGVDEKIFVEMLKKHDLI